MRFCLANLKSFADAPEDERIPDKITDALKKTTGMVSLRFTLEQALGF